MKSYAYKNNGETERRNMIEHVYPRAHCVQQKRRNKYRLDVTLKPIEIKEKRRT